MTLRLIKTLWRVVPVSLRNRFWVWFQNVSVARPDLQATGISPGEPVVVAGMFRTASGLGTWARSTYHALKAAGYAVTAVDLSESLAMADFDCGIPLEPFPAAQKGTLILHVNGPETAYSLRKLGLRRGRQWRVIGAWAWELSAFPPGWDAAFPFISEIWALSDFAAEAFRRHNSAPPVRVLPISISAPKALAGTDSGAAARPFTVIVMADALSSFKRKNPVGAIQAFRAAFGDRADCRLIVKVRNLDAMPEEAVALHAAIAGADNIELINKSLDTAQQWALIARADVFLSLHRAEGFGLGPAEAMSLGIPVVATDWSGNLYYMNAETAALIPCTFVPVPEDCIHYSVAGAVWAEPDAEAASQWLQRLESDRELGRRFATLAKLRVEEICGAGRVQGLVTDLLKAVPAQRH
tara:strand:+ start:365 stop:1597 length:1233 start_codon:yes stop_codon:yes gene_type:complete